MTEPTYEEMKARLADWKAPQPRYKSGVMAKYARQVSSAARGAVTTEFEHETAAATAGWHGDSAACM